MYGPTSVPAQLCATYSSYENRSSGGAATECRPTFILQTQSNREVVSLPPLRQLVAARSFFRKVFARPPLVNQSARRARAAPFARWLEARVDAEPRSREALLADWERLNWITKLDLPSRGVGAFWDAMRVGHATSSSPHRVRLKEISAPSA